jgi:transposase
MLSQFCRECKGNYADYLEDMPALCPKMGLLFRSSAFLCLDNPSKRRYTCQQHLLSLEVVMSDEKLKALHAAHTLHPHPDAVRDPLFTSGSPFFDPRDLVQVKYELLRRVRVDGYSVSQATALFALSRPTFYAAQSAWEQAGISGLLPRSTGPRHAHKLTEEIVAELQPLAPRLSAAELAVWLQERRGLSVHPRSIERALKRAAEKGGTA